MKAVEGSFDLAYVRSRNPSVEDATNSGSRIHISANMGAPLLSNVNTYLAIAQDSLAASLQIAAEQTRPMPDGLPGEIKQFDPTRASFRQSIVATVFAGVYLDALLYIAIRNRFGLGEFEKINTRRGRYKAYLDKLEVTDPVMLEDCERLNNARNAIVHEKAMEMGPSSAGKLYVAQREAEHALEFVRTVAARLHPK